MRFSWLLSLVLIALPAYAKDTALSIQGGVVQRQQGEQITIWSNSPQTSCTIGNTGREFYHAKLHWKNVPAGSFLVTPQGVADALSRNGGTISSSVSVAGGSKASWQLNSNIKGNYRFVVVSGPSSSAILKRVNNDPQKPHFAIHLGNGSVNRGYNAFLGQLSTLSFPTYLIPGSRDRAANFLKLCGKSKQIFDIGEDRFVFVDNRTGRLGRNQYAWLKDVLTGKHRHTFVFFHRPMYANRRSARPMSDRMEVARLASLFEKRKVTAVFAGSSPQQFKKNRHAVTYYSTGERVIAVNISAQGVSIQPQ